MSDTSTLDSAEQHQGYATPAATHQDFVSEADDHTFEERVLKRSLEVPVLVDCWAEWCEPCKTLGPTLEGLATQYKGRFELVKVDIERAQQVAMMLRVQSVPFMMLFVGGRPVDAIAGNHPESALRAFLDRHIPPDEEDPYELGMAAFKEGDYPLASATLEQVLSAHPERVEVRLTLARIALAQGDLNRASIHLDQIPNEHPLALTARQLRGLFELAELQADEGELEARLIADPRDVDAWYRRGVNSALRGDFESACTLMLKVVALDRTYREDAGRQALLLIFEVLGGEGEVVARARRNLATYLF